MAFSLAPGFVRIQYTIDHFAHIMTRGTRAWIAGEDLGDPGSYTAWDGSNIAANTMALDLATLLAAGLTEDVSTVDFYEIWSQPDPDDDPLLVYSANVNLAGSVTPTAMTYIANQATYNFLDTGGKKGKMVVMESPLPNYTPISVITDLSTEQENLLGALTEPSNAWSSRAGGLFFTFRKATFKQNDKLRRARHLS